MSVESDNLNKPSSIPIKGKPGGDDRKPLGEVALNAPARKRAIAPPSDQKPVKYTSREENSSLSNFRAQSYSLLLAAISLKITPRANQFAATAKTTPTSQSAPSPLSAKNASHLLHDATARMQALSYLADKQTPGGQKSSRNSNR